MGCPLCERIKARNEAATSELEFRASSNFVVGKNGQPQTLNKSLVAEGRSPSGGWGVRIRIKGQVHQFSGANASAVYTAVRKTLVLNGISISERDLWLNLNIQWIKSCNEKYQMIRLADLMAAAAPVTTVAKNHVASEDWMQPMIDAIGMWLASDSYSNSRLTQWVTELRDMADPVRNPALGDSALFMELSNVLSRLNNAPIYRREQARDWFCATFELDPAAASAQYYWQ